MTKDQFDFFETYKMDDEKAKKILESNDASELLDHYFKNMTEDVVNDFANNLNKALPIKRPILRRTTQEKTISELTNSFTNKPDRPLKKEIKNNQPINPSSHENQTEEKKEPSINYVHKSQKSTQKSYADSYTKKQNLKKGKKEKIIHPTHNQNPQKKKSIPAKPLIKKHLSKRLHKIFNYSQRKSSKIKNAHHL